MSLAIERIPMNRRRFMKDATQAGMTMGVSGSLLASAASAAETEETTTTKPAQNGEAARRTKSNRNLVVGTPVIVLDGNWLLATDPQNIGRNENWFAQPGAK